MFLDLKIFEDEFDFVGEQVQLLDFVQTRVERVEKVFVGQSQIVREHVNEVN